MAPGTLLPVPVQPHDPESLHADNEDFLADNPRWIPQLPGLPDEIHPDPDFY
jgi:hypothetical protein